MSRSICQGKSHSIDCNFLIKHPEYTPFIVAVVAVLELSDNEKDFDEHFLRITTA